MTQTELIRRRIAEAIEVKQALMESDVLIRRVAELAEKMVDCLSQGGKLVICGNGGSASDALLFAGEIVGRFVRERRAWPAVVLSADVTTMATIADDYGYDDVLARQAEALLNPEDILIAISTNGDCERVYRAVLKARELGARSAALLGKDGGRTGLAADYALMVPCSVSARVQECHVSLIHILCEITEAQLAALESYE